MTPVEIAKEFEMVLADIAKTHQIRLKLQEVLTDDAAYIKAGKAEEQFMISVNVAMNQICRKYPHCTPGEIEKAVKRTINKYKNEVVIIDRKKI